MRGDTWYSSEVASSTPAPALVALLDAGSAACPPLRRPETPQPLLQHQRSLAPTAAGHIGDRQSRRSQSRCPHLSSAAPSSRSSWVALRSGWRGGDSVRWSLHRAIRGWPLHRSWWLGPPPPCTPSEGKPAADFVDRDGSRTTCTPMVWGAEVPKSTPPRFEGPLNHGRFVHNAAPPYHTLFRPFRYHPGAARSPLKPVETASGC